MEYTIEVRDLRTGELAEPLGFVSGSFSAQPQYRLFSPESVVVAALVGTPAAGMALMAVNYWRLGRNGRAWMMSIVAAALGVLMALVALRIPPLAVGLLVLGLLVVLRMAVMGLQARSVERHTAAGGKLASMWIAAAIGLGILAGIVAIDYALMGRGQTRTKVVIGSKDEVYYAGGATEADAIALGNALKSAGYFQDKGSSVFLSKDEASKDGQAKGALETTISMVVQEGAWQDAAILRKEEEVVREVADSVGGLPVHVRVIDANERVWRQGVVGRSSVNGKDEVLYFGRATAEQAVALDRKLGSEEYFTGHSTSVLLNSDDDGTTLSFVIEDTAGVDAEKMDAFVQVARDVAEDIGGLPVRVRLVDAGFDMKAEQMVR